MPMRRLDAKHMAVDLHFQLMPLVWTILIDITTLAALHTYKTTSMIFHFIGAAMTILLTVYTSLDLLMEGVPAQGQFMRLHVQIGITIYILMGTQALLGAISYVMRLQGGHHIMLKIKKIHKYLGYFINLLGKFQLIYIFQVKNVKFWLVLLWSLATFLYFLHFKINTQHLQSSPAILKPSKIDGSNYSGVYNLLTHPIFYGNSVFDGSSLVNHHPAGFNIIKKVKGRCVQRYMFGLHTEQIDKNISLHSHSINSIQLLNQPIETIKIPQIELKQTNGFFPVEIAGIQKMSHQANVNIVQLKVACGQSIQSAGYVDIRQLGRYYWLRLNNKQTRLYTIVNFLNPKNMNFMNRFLLENKSISQNQQHQGSGSSWNHTTIRLAIKWYVSGRVSPKILASNTTNIEISSAKGRGFDWNSVQSGRIVMFAGGTGILPFCDLIDLLFKSQIVKKHPQFQTQIFSLSPIISQRKNSQVIDILQQRNFHFFFAVDFISEIHEVTLNQLNYLSEHSSRVKVGLKIKHDRDQAFTKLPRSHNRFELIVQSLIHQQQIGRIYVCGPPGMVESIQTVLNANNFINYTVM